MAKQVFFRRKKACPFSGEDGLKIDYKDVKLLSRYISEKGKIIPSSFVFFSRILHDILRRLFGQESRIDGI